MALPHPVEEAVPLLAAEAASLLDFRAFFQMETEGLCVADAGTGRLLQVNRRLCQMTGYSEHDLLGMTSYDLVHPAEAKLLRTGWRKMLRQAQGGFTSEQRCRTKDGELIWVEASFTPVRESQPLRVVGIVRDISDRRRAIEEWERTRQDLETRVVMDVTERQFLERALLEASERESRRIGQELHDHLCQHLLGAAFSAKAISMGFPKDSPASAELNHLAGLINSAVQQARDVARGLNPVEMDAAGLMAALQELADRPKAGIACRLECQRNVLLMDAEVALHAFRIAQEAVANAVAHSGGTEVVIRLSADRHNIVLQIQDDGRGFDLKSGRGQGLGLEIMKYRAHAISGKVIVDTARDRGTSVMLVLPK